MKKLFLTIAIILGMSLGAFAQERGGGLFGKGPQYDGYENQYGESRTEGLINLPTSHGENDDVQAPLGSGALLLIGFGAAYALKKRKK
ncbi:MAG: hypothetical protein IKM85_11105 [Bacteroidales bacterium]|nr:hypothetical protein [Bacteroidales bacterium]